jgi:serine/threonine-protein kinase
MSEAGELKLFFTQGPLRGSKFLVERRISVGRHVSNDIVIADPCLSLVHCKVYFQDGRAVIQDQGSTNGVTLNGKRVISMQLRDGDVLGFGQNLATVQWTKAVEETPGASPPNSSPETLMLPNGLAPREPSGNIFGSVTYFLKRKIADGGMGSIYEAEQYGAEGFIKKVAIKTILPEFVREDVFVSAFVGEAKLVANLVHQNIVQIHHLGRQENGYYIAMEYIDGISLTEFMLAHDRQGRSVPPKIATFIVSRMARGLEYAHNRCGENGDPLNLVHRDISPNNIMITREGEVKITDFGVAKATQFVKKEEEGVLVGSLEYMAPEQARLGTVDARSDIFAVGLNYYELLTGIRVFSKIKGETVEQSIIRLLETPIPDPREHRPDLPDSAADIVMRACQKDVTARYQSAGELAFALETDLYSQGYGPTIVTLARYIQRLCPR